MKNSRNRQVPEREAEYNLVSCQKLVDIFAGYFNCCLLGWSKLHIAGCFEITVNHIGIHIRKLYLEQVKLNNCILWMALFVAVQESLINLNAHSLLDSTIISFYK
ncbi:hypothetical protein D3C78_1390250 [compost metagenome]